MPYSKPQMVFLACAVAVAVAALVLALDGCRGSWFTFVAMLMVIGQALYWGRRHRG